MYVYLVTARSDTSTVVQFLFIAFIDSRVALKLFRFQAFFFTKSSFFKKSSPSVTLLLACLYNDYCQKLSYHSLLLNQYTNKLPAFLSTSKNWESLHKQLIIPSRLSVAACLLTYKVSYNRPILLRLRG